MGWKTVVQGFFAVSLVSLQKSMAFYAFFTLKPRVFLSFWAIHSGRSWWADSSEPSGDSRRSSRGHPLVLQEETVPVFLHQNRWQNMLGLVVESHESHHESHQKKKAPWWRSDVCSKHGQNIGIHGVLWPKKIDAWLTLSLLKSLSSQSIS